MKLAIVSGTFFPLPGGVQVQVHNICNKLFEKKYNIDCYIFNKTQIKNNNYNILIFSKFLTSIVFFFKYYLNININFILKIYLKKIIRKKNYKIWHFMFLNFKCLLLIDCLKDLDQKIITTFHGADVQIDKEINYGFRIDKKYDNYFKKIINKIDHFFYISNTIKEDLMNLSIPEKKMSFNPNGIEINKFKNSKINFNKRQKIHLITVARYSEKKKGYDKLSNISEGLIKNKIDFKWTIIGKNTLELLKNDFIKKNLKYFEIIENIDNINEAYFPHSRLIKKYVESDLYINLSRIESFGITYVEALAANIPIITFNSKGVNEIVSNNYNGYILESNEQMIKKIIELYENPSNINEIRKNLFSSIKMYDLNSVTDKIIDTYESLYNQK